MIILLALIALVFVHIAYKDIKHRLVYRYDLLALVALRVIALVVVLVGDYCFGVTSVLGLTGEQWGIPSLILSVALALIACAFVQGVAYITNRLTNKYGAKKESIGLGDVKLYAACCLFVTVDGFLSFLLLSALFGVLLALVYKFGKKQATFPFAPAIVLACFVVLLAESLGVL